MFAGLQTTLCACRVNCQGMVTVRIYFQGRAPRNANVPVGLAVKQQVEGVVRAVPWPNCVVAGGEAWGLGWCW